MDDFKIIAITRPEFFPEESRMINEFLSTGEADFVHIRKPGASKHEVENLLREIEPRFLSKIKLHDFFELAALYPVGGIHLNSRNPERPEGACNVSISLHSLDEIAGADEYDYFFISPVFDSISKEGYKAAFDLEELAEAVRGKKSVALGGVTPEKIPILKEMGFKGAALLSHFFGVGNQNLTS